MERESSFGRVPYDVRPAKQAERRMILDALVRLMAGGFDIARYRYLGMGSLQFVEFSLFHRALGIGDLISVEWNASRKKRVEFNKPYVFIKTTIGSLGDQIRDIDPDLKHIVWADYDFPVGSVITGDIIEAIRRLQIGSVFIVTVDVDAPKEGETPREWYEAFQTEVGAFFGVGWTAEDFSASKLPKRSVEILCNAVAEGISRRGNVNFELLFNFLYRDTSWMATVGGVICGETEAAKVSACNFRGASYVRRSWADEAFTIRVPVLTRRERLFLDTNMPSKGNWKPRLFELTQDDIEAYRAIQRFVPSYAELIDI